MQTITNVKQLSAEEKEVLFAKWKEIISTLGVAFPSPMKMVHWNAIMPVQKRIVDDVVTEIEGIVEMIQVLNVWSVQNVVIKDRIFDMELHEFEAISLYVWEYIENNAWNKKK